MKKYSIVKLVVCILLPLILLAQGENWIFRYNGPGNYDDCATSIAYGGDGNIYVAGYSSSIDSNLDFTVISLTTAGDTNWVYKYNGSGNSVDWAKSIIYGADSNIYVVGNSTSSGSWSDCTIINLTTAGNTNWIYRYNESTTLADYGNSIVYGADGNIYVAGASFNIFLDFMVISLTTAGDTNWVYRYNGPGNDYDQANSLVYGADGNIYTAGATIGNGTYDDFTVISLTTAGDTNWVYRYNGPGNNSDEAYSIIFGADGNIYAAGISSGDFVVISLTTAGNTNWVYRYNGPGNSADCARSLVFGADGNIYAAGISTDSVTSGDFTVISLTTAGNVNLIYRYNGPANQNDDGTSIVYGVDGNVYAAGYSIGSGTTDDFTVISLTTAGDTNWVYRYIGPGNSRDYATSIIYGADNNIYAAGASYGIGTDYDITVISLPPDFSVEEENNAVIKGFYCATIFNGPLQLPKDKKCKVFDITGRIVIPDKIKPGVYFIQIDNKIVQKVVKIR
jgi:uncharacterized delta-60 repeat protein